MGGSNPSAPQVVMPAPAAPIVFQSLVPEQSYKDLAAQMGRYQQQRGEIEKQRYSEVGTPGEIGARQRARDVKTEEAYLASLPGRKPAGSVDRYKAYTTGQPGGLETASGTHNKPDTFTRSYSGARGMMEPPRGVSNTALSGARAQYADALNRVNEVPAPPKTEKPSWADEELWKGVMEQTKTVKTG
jgi:hypothetical protein|tara:strand:- start:574 stop:1134 length:561 start_codon:yes stop_codon:yes gene_type:complete